MKNASRKLFGSKNNNIKSHAEVLNKVILNWFQNLQRLLWLLSLRNGMRGISRNKFGMTSFNNNGFTLIELLVVVLIIGILAAVAVPQYNKAVAKTRLTEVMTRIPAIEKTMDLYVLEHGYENVGFFRRDGVEADIDVKAGLDCPENDNSCFSKRYKYQGGCEPESDEEDARMRCRWVIWDISGGQDGFYVLYAEKFSGENSWTHYCEYDEDDAVATAICTQLYNQGWTQGDYYF